MSGEFRVVTHGVHELTAAFTETTFRVDPVLGKALRELAKPVQQEAQDLAFTAASNMTQPWSRMRIGRKLTTVYVAEKERGTKTPWKKRPNLNTLLQTQALEPALEKHKAEIEAGTAAAIAVLCKETEKEMFPV